MKRALLIVGLVAVIAVGIVLVGLLRSGAVTPTEALPAPRMVDETSTSGVTHVYTGGSRYFEGGGVAVFDCDADGLDDLFLAGGEGVSALYRNQSARGGPLSFEADGGAAGLDMDAVTGGYPIDIDSDGIIDLVVLRIGENVLFRGLGDCRFERANEAWGFDGGAEWTAAFSATWEEGERFPTLAFGNYLKLDDALNQEELCASNVVVRPDGDGFSPPMQLDPSWCTLSVLFSDWDRDGVADLRVTNDRQYYRSGEEQLWRIGEVPTSYTREEGWNHLQIWGMGIASQDVTGDGLPEIYLTSQGDNRLQTLEEGAEAPSYTDIAIRRGVTAHRPYTGDPLPSTGWHPEWEDVNNDGFVDLYVSKGNVDAMPDFTLEDPNNLLLGQPDGTFVEGGMDAGIVYFAKTRGSAVVDLNDDGLLDLVEVNRVEPVRLWRNVGSGTADAPAQMGNWITVTVESDGVNRSAVGHWIEVRIADMAISREITIGGGHAGGQLGVHHFGIGPSPFAEVRVVSPDGSASEWTKANAGDHLEITVG